MNADKQDRIIFLGVVVCVVVFFFIRVTYNYFISNEDLKND